MPLPESLKESHEIHLDPATGELQSGGKVVNNDFSAVDKFTTDTGSVATVFARKGDDFLRVTTSLKKQDGERAMGTLLDRAHPAYPLMLAGQTYTGRAVLFGKPYMTHYEPALDAAGKVVGILFVGTDVSAFDASVAKQVAEVRFFETGGLYVVDPRSGLSEAVFLVHPEAKGKKVLEAFPQADKFFTVLAAAPDGYADGAPNLIGPPASEEWSLLRDSIAFQTNILVRDAGSTMDEIVASVQHVGAMLAEITAAASEQSQGIAQVNTAVNQLDQMTQQNAALVEESAAASESLKEQAARLSEAVAVFQLGNKTDVPDLPDVPVATAYARSK